VFPRTDDDSAVGKELGSVATAIGMAVDRYDQVPNEMFPDTAEETLDRWEAVTRRATNTTDSLAARRARVLAVLRRTSGPRLDQLAKMLAAPLGLDEADIVWVEGLRANIEAALMQENSDTHAITSTPTIIPMGKPWPGVVDDTGVRIYLALSALGTPTVTVTSPEGTVWTVDVTAASGWYQNRTDFEGEIAGGTWTVSIANGSSVNLTDLKLLVSNNVDAAQIYNFFAFCDPDLSATPDLIEAQRLFHRTALGHFRAFVTQSLAFTVGDPHSLVGRDPVGG
jgi:hypothetical protein